MTWAIAQNLPTKEKFVLLMLANYANAEEWDCYPSMDTIARDTGMHRDSVKRAVASLKEANLVTVIHRKEGNVNLSNLYRLHVIGAHSTEGRCSQHQRVGAHSTTILSVDPVNDPISPTNVGEAVSAKTRANDPCPHQEIISLYHEILPNHPEVRIWHAARKKAMKARWVEHPSLAWWKSYFEDVSGSKFLTGRTQANGRPPFMATLEWLINPTNLTKVYEGKYHEG